LFLGPSVLPLRAYSRGIGAHLTDARASLAGACTQMKIVQLNVQGKVKAISREGQIRIPTRVYLLGLAGTRRLTIV